VDLYGGLYDKWVKIILGEDKLVLVSLFLPIIKLSMMMGIFS
jgi:hypothetical protein